MPIQNSTIGDGQVIAPIDAWEMIDNFSSPATYFAISKTDITTFTNQIEADFPSTVIEPGYSIGLRFYVGKPTVESGFQCVVVPICGPDRNPETNERDHSLDTEATFFEDNGKTFYALNIANGAIIDLDTAAPKIVVKDTLVVDPDPDNKLATQVVYYSLAEVKAFCDALTSDDMKVYFARIDAGDCLTVVIEGTETSTLKYFDKGDLIPPPPPNSYGPITDTSF